MGWLQTNTSVPRWSPAPLRHPLLGYLFAVLLELTFTFVLLLLRSLFPTFDYRAILSAVGVVLIALGWGAGPGLCATLTGAFLLYYALLPPAFSLSLTDPADALGLGLYVVVGVSISLLVGRSERARRQAEDLAHSLAQAQAQSEADARRLRAVLDVLPVAVIIAGPQGQWLEVNTALNTLWGEEVPLASEIAEYSQYPARWVMTGQSLAAEDWTLARVLRNGEAIFNDELELATADGQHKIILNSAIPLRDATGALTGAVVCSQDITERRRLEHEVAEHAAQLEAIFESIVDGVVVTDAQGRVQHTNQALRTLHGLERDPTGWTLPQLEALAGFTSYTPAGQRLVENGGIISRILLGEVLINEQSVDTILRTRDGRETLLNSTGAPIRDATGQLLGAVLVARDVTERRRLEQRTREALEALLAMAEALVQTPDSGAAGREAGPQAAQAARRLAELTRQVLGCQQVSIVAVEPGTEAMVPITLVGLPPEQEQQWWADLAGHPAMRQRLQPPVVAALQMGEPVLLERLQPPLPIWQQLTPAHTSWLTPMRIGETLIGLLRVDDRAQGDKLAGAHQQALLRAVARLGALVLERERLLHQRTEAQANELALRETQAQMETFLGIAGHELKNPLTGIKLSLQLAKRRLHRFVQHQFDGSQVLASFRDQLELAEHRAERLERLIDDLLDVSRVRAGKLDLHPEPKDLAVIVQEAVEEQRQVNPERTIAFLFPSDRVVPVMADADRIGQVVTNYLTNALKYSPADRPVAVGLEVDEQQARVWVRDQGPGLPREEQERIWERFQRVKGIEVVSGTGVGLGLGLHISRTIIQRHQGQVGVESAPGQGATFWFTLPLTAVPG